MSEKSPTSYIRYADVAGRAPIYRTCRWVRAEARLDATIKLPISADNATAAAGDATPFARPTL
jgi:hypothetical protein